MNLIKVKKIKLSKLQNQKYEKQNLRYLMKNKRKNHQLKRNNTLLE